MKGESDHKCGTCKWCGDHGDIYKDTLLCDACDGDTVYCGVCRRRQHRDDNCRHVFQDEEFQWRGAGVYPCDEEMERAFHRFLSAMGEEFSVSLKAAIASVKFHTWMVAPMIGGGGYLTLYGMHNREGCNRFSNGWGDKIIELVNGPRADELHDGYRWLVSLYDRKTTKANRTTVAWIDNWLWPFARGRA
jgi:hypothetical protein